MKCWMRTESAAAAFLLCAAAAAAAPRGWSTDYQAALAAGRASAKHVLIAIVDSANCYASRAFRRDVVDNEGWTDWREGNEESLLLVWWDGKPAAEPRQPLAWKGEGINPVAVFRTSWTDPNAAFLAVKAGTPAANHGHMDTGSFIYEADGVRCALDLGAESYGKLEARGMGIWDRKQGSDRWRIFCYHNISHNTLTVDGAEQVVAARADFTRFSARKARAVMDLSAVYGGQLARARE